MTGARKIFDKMEKRNSRIRRQVFESLAECIECARKGKQTKIMREGLKHPNDLLYNQQYLIKSRLCEDCFGSNNLSHLEPSVKAEIQCKNWGIKKECLRYFHIKSVRVLAKSRGESYIEKSPVRPKVLMTRGLCMRCIDWD